MPISMMPSTDFWRLIDSSNRGWRRSRSRFLDRLRRALERLSDDDLVAFDMRQSEEELRSYTWDLWAAAYIIQGGCSDDGFEYFRAWLMSRGSAVWEAALRDPDSLSSVRGIRPGSCDLEELLSIAPSVFEMRSGENLYDRLPQPPDEPTPAQPAGVPFKEDESDLQTRCPKLYSKFWNRPRR